MATIARSLGASLLVWRVTAGSQSVIQSLPQASQMPFVFVLPFSVSAFVCICVYFSMFVYARLYVCLCLSYVLATSLCVHVCNCMCMSVCVHLSEAPSVYVGSCLFALFACLCLYLCLLMFLGPKFGQWFYETQQRAKC